MKAYLLERQDSHLYMVFGDDCVKAGEILIDKIGGSVDDLMVVGSYEVDLSKPIDLSEMWPHFTCHPYHHANPEIILPKVSQ